MILRNRIFSARGPYIFAHSWCIDNSYGPFILREKPVYFQHIRTIYFSRPYIHWRTVYLKTKIVFFTVDPFYVVKIHFTRKDRIFSTYKDHLFEPTVYSSGGPYILSQGSYILRLTRFYVVKIQFHQVIWNCTKSCSISSRVLRFHQESWKN